MNFVAKKSRVALISIMIFALIFSFVAVAFATSRVESSKERIIVVFNNKEMKQASKKHIKQKGGEIISEFDIVPGMAISIDSDEISDLKALKGVKQVGPDGEIHASDMELDTSWGVKRIGAEKAHVNSVTGKGVKVAIIDSGIDYTHPDLDANYAGGYDFINNDNDPMDDFGHGTHVAGILAAEDNGFGVVGTAPEASIYALKVLGADGGGYWSDVIKALDWCWKNEEIQVVNLSLEGYEEAPGLHEAIKNAYDAGIVLVAAAGNSAQPKGNGNTIAYPARYNEVIAVGATDNLDQRAFFSSTGKQLELVAPGFWITSTIPNGGYLAVPGTSMAAPHVAGTAALVLANGNLSDLNDDGMINNKDLRLLLQQTADDLGEPGKDFHYGYGMVDANEAVMFNTLD